MVHDGYQRLVRIWRRVAAYFPISNFRRKGPRQASALAMIVLVALSRTAFTAVAATSYSHTLRQHAARAVLNAYDGPDEVVTERAYVGPHDADADWATKYEGPHEADADWATTYEGPREADADWATQYEGPHEAAGLWSLPSVLWLIDLPLGPLRDFNATMVDGVPISSFHTLFDRCYEPAAPGCVRRCGSRPVPYQPCAPTMSPCEPPACLSTAKHPLSPHPSSSQELVVEGGVPLRQPLRHAGGGRDSWGAALRSDAV